MTAHHSKGRRLLTAEEKRLWSYVTREDMPLTAASRNAPEPAPVAALRLTPQAYRNEWIAPRGCDSMPLSCASYAGIDRNTANRFRKGEFPIDAVIDLHGMSREKAHMALGGFLKSHYERGSRCLLAITGKGTRKDNIPFAGEELGEYPPPPLASRRALRGGYMSPSPTESRGVLRDMLPQWLAEPGLRPLVLAFDVARPQHGGSGAYYILLRRKR